MKVQLLFILTFLFSSNIGMTQSIDPDDSFTIELGLPNSFSNQPFKEIMQGLVCVSPYYQYAFKNGLAIGAGEDTKRRSFERTASQER